MAKTIILDGLSYSLIHTLAAMTPPPARIKEGFPKQRLIVLPANIIHRAQQLPLVSGLYVTHIGSYPKEKGQSA